MKLRLDFELRNENRRANKAILTVNCEVISMLTASCPARIRSSVTFVTRTAKARCANQTSTRRPSSLRTAHATECPRTPVQWTVFNALRPTTWTQQRNPFALGSSHGYSRDSRDTTGRVRVGFRWIRSADRFQWPSGLAAKHRCRSPICLWPWPATLLPAPSTHNARCPSQNHASSLHRGPHAHAHAPRSHHHSTKPRGIWVVAGLGSCAALLHTVRPFAFS